MEALLSSFLLFQLFVSVSSVDSPQNNNSRVKSNKSPIFVLPQCSFVLLVRDLKDLCLGNDDRCRDHVHFVYYLFIYFAYLYIFDSRYQNLSGLVFIHFCCLCSGPFIHEKKKKTQLDKNGSN